MFRNLKRDWSLVPGPFYFYKFCVFKRTVVEWKNIVTFLLIIFFQNILFSAEFVACSGCFMLFTKVKKESATSFFPTFSAWLFHKNVPYLILDLWTNDIYLWTLFMDDDMINFKIYCQSSSKAKANTQNRREE